MIPNNSEGGCNGASDRKSPAGRNAEDDTLDLAKSYFDLKEYDRAAFFAKNLQSHAGTVCTSDIGTWEN